MDGSEIVVFIVSALLTGRFVVKWYRKLCNIWPAERAQFSRVILGILPVFVLIAFLYTLNSLASFDVVGAWIYKAFYVLLGFAWLSVGLALMSLWLDISWIDDAVNMNNQGALWAVTGGALGQAIIYCGANIGDGPGWWCVIFAGGLGTAAWFVLAYAASKITGISERITVERDVSCGIRFGFLLLANGIILGRASAGDWTSFSMTLIEFVDGWPVLFLTVFAIIVEVLHMAWQHSGASNRPSRVLSSICCGAVYVAIAIIVVILLPALGKNPVYGVLL